MQDSYKSSWEQAISDVDEYFAKNIKQAEALRGKVTAESDGKEREVDEVQVALPGTAITLEEKIERFNDKVKTHLKFMEQDFTPIMNKSFQEIYYSYERTPEEDLIVRAATAALNPADFHHAITDKNVKVGQVANQIQKSNLNTVVEEMLDIDAQRRKARLEEALEPKDEQKGNIWDDLGHILDKITSTLASHKMETGVDKAVRVLSVSPDPTPQPTKQQGGIAPSI